MPLHSVNYSTVERFEPGHYNPHDNIVVSNIHGAHELRSGCGSRDYVSVLRDGDTYYVLCYDDRLPYVGLASYVITGPTSPYRKRKELIAAAESSDERASPSWSVENSGEFFAQEGNVDEVLGEDENGEPNRLSDIPDAELVETLSQYISG